MNNEIERILHAAVRHESGWIFLGKSHANCFHQAGNVGMQLSSRVIGQGFVTNKARFVSREDGYEIALAANQINPLPEEPLDPEVYDLEVASKKRKMLFSEDMWSEMYRAKHNYDTIKGYVLKDVCKECGAEITWSTQHRNGCSIIPY